MSVSNAFTGSALGAGLVLPAGQSVTYEVTGTFTGQCFLERLLKGGISVTEIAATVADTALAEATYQNITTKSQTLRWRGVIATGTATAVIDEVANELVGLADIIDPVTKAVLIRFRDDAIEFPQPRIQSGPSDHMRLNTIADNRQVRINSRSYTQTSGDSLAFQAKPSQTVNSSGSVQGGQISPRLQSGVTLGGSLIGLHVDTDLKGTAAGTVTGDVRVLELEMVADVGGGRTITGDVTAIRVRSFMPASGGVTGSKSVMKIETVESGGVAYDGILDLKLTAADLYNDTDSGAGGSLDGFIKVLVNGNARYIRLYDAAPG